MRYFRNIGDTNISPSMCLSEYQLKRFNRLPRTSLLGGRKQQVISYVQTVPNLRRLLIIDDKSLPHKQRRAFTRLLIFKIKFLSEPPSRWLAGSAEMTPVIGNAREGSRRGHANHRARELSVNPKKSWSLNLRLNLKIANFQVRLYCANQRPNRWWLSFRPNL